LTDEELRAAVKYVLGKIRPDGADGSTKPKPKAMVHTLDDRQKPANISWQ
jgi:hypothetical protein